MAARAYLAGERSFLRMGAAFPWLVALTLIAAASVPIAGRGSLYDYPILPVRHFAIAVIALAALFGPAGRALVRAAAPLAKPAAFAASISYGLYILHYPLLVQSDRAASPAGLAGMAVLLVALAILADRELNRVLPKIRRGSPN